MTPKSLTADQILSGRAQAIVALKKLGQERLIADLVVAQTKAAPLSDLDVRADAVIRKAQDLPVKPDFRLPYQGIFKLPAVRPALVEADYIAAAARLGCDVDALKAVVRVECRASGFLPTGAPVILFEALWFHRLTYGKYDVTHPTISSEEWNPRLYRGGLAEYERLNKAIVLDKTAALESTSWGLGQVMGANYRQAGFTSVSSFVSAMYDSERAQLLAMVNFIQVAGLNRSLQRLEWETFARGYNGKGYQANQYDLRLKNAYQRLKGAA